MDWMQGLADLAWRDWLLVLILVVAVYMLAVYFRWRRVTHHHRKEQAAAAAQVKAPIEPRLTREPRGGAFAERPLRGRGIETLSDELARDPIATLARSNADHEAIERLQQENVQLKEELAALRASFAAVRDELRQEVAKLKAGQQVSPLYGDSMQMALAGASAEVIAARCGIARAEAELVIALVHSRQGDDTSGVAARGENKSGRPKQRGPY
jgi:hypothetical protein